VGRCKKNPIINLPDRSALPKLFCCKATSLKKRKRKKKKKEKKKQKIMREKTLERFNQRTLQRLGRHLEEDAVQNEGNVENTLENYGLGFTG